MANCRTLSSIGIDTCTGNKGGIYTEVLICSREDLKPVREGNEDGLTPNTETGYVKSKDAAQNDHLTIPSTAYYVKFRKNSSSLTSEGTFDEANGVYFFTNNLNLVIARQDVSKRLAIQSLALAGDIAVIVKDGNNEIQFLGMDDTVSCTALTAQTGTASTDGNNYNMTLTDTSKELPYYVYEDDWDAIKAVAEDGGSN